MPGLIQSTLPNSQQVVGAETVTVDPTLRTVNPETESVAGQLNTILAKGSPLIDVARSGAMETANSRGLLNSSIAAGAGEKAAIETALPIAQQDAATYSQAAGVNQAASNTGKLFNAGSVNTSNLNQAQAGNTSLQTTQAGQIQSNLSAQAGRIQSDLSAQAATQERTTQTLIQQMRGDQATTLANIESQYKQLTQTNAGAANFFAETQKQLVSALGNPNTSADQKASEVSAINATLQSGLAVIGAIANLDLGGLLNFSGQNVVPA